MCIEDGVCVVVLTFFVTLFKEIHTSSFTFDQMIKLEAKINFCG